MNLVVPWEQEHPDEERDPLDKYKTCVLDDDCWEPVELGDFALPHLYLGVFSVCTMLAVLKDFLTGPEHPYIKGYRLVFYGLSSTILFTLFNLYLFIVLSTKNSLRLTGKLPSIEKCWLTCYMDMGQSHPTSSLLAVW